MYKARIITGVISTIWICLMGQVAGAEEQSNLAMVYYVDAKDGHQDKLIEAISEHAQWRREEGDPWTWDVFQIVVGDNLGRIIIRSGGHTWADFDEYADFDAKGGAEWNKNVGPHIGSIVNSIKSTDEEVGNWRPGEAELNLVSIIYYDLKPGAGKDFYQAIKKYHETIMEHDYDATYSFIWTVRGSGDSDVLLAIPHENYADMAPPEEKMRDFMKRILGKEEADKVLKQFTDSISDSSSIVIKYMPELSVQHD